MQMNIQSPERLLFLRALDFPADTDRREQLLEATEGDEALADRVLRLLQAHNEVGEFLDPEASDPLAVTLTDANHPTTPERKSAQRAAAGGFLASLEPCDAPDRLGRMGNYEIVEVVGHGGMGLVMRAVDIRLQREVAVKVIQPELASNGDVVRRFQREAQLAAAVRNDHIVTVYSVEEWQGRPFMVMEYISGHSLKEELKSFRDWRFSEVVRIGLELASGLAAAHRSDLIHRDIKPANVLLEDDSRRVRITDFGLARMDGDPGISRTGEIAGTPQYMSPEQIELGRVDARSDLFSLGCVLYALCAGRSPFHSDSVLTSLRLVCDSEPTPLQQVVEEVPDWFARLVHSLLQKKPDDRIQSAEEVEAILTAHLSVLTDTSAIPHSELPMSSVARGTDICQDGVFGPTHAAAETLVAEPMPASRRLTRKVAVTAALISLLCLTETSGITHLAGLVVRISRDVPFRVESATTADTEPVGDNTFTVKLAHGGKEVGTLSYTPEDSGTADARTHRAARNRKAETPPPPMAKPESHTEPTVNLLGTWTVPERLTIRVHEHEITGRPWISADGLTILFESDRAGSFGRTDVWMAVRSTRKQPFGAAVNLGTKINTSAKEADPCLSPDGMTLFFNATPQRGGHGRSDLWMATRSVPDGEFDAAVNVGPLVNSDSADTGAVLSADGLVLMFASAREGSFGDEDLWICQRPDLNSPWQPPQNAGSGINTEHRETSPELSADGLQLWFVSDRPGTFGDRDLWIAVRPSADEPFGTPVNAGPGINTDGIEESPTLTADGRLLLFESSRRLTENDPGLEDIWMSELISITE